MEYSIYERLAEQYIIEQHGSLDDLKSYNYMLEEETLNYMLNQLLQYCSSDPNEIKNAMNINREYWKQFIGKDRK